MGVLGGFDPRKEFLKAAGGASSAIGNVVDVASTAIDGAVNGARTALDEAAAERQRKAEDEYRPLVNGARASLGDSRAGDFADAFIAYQPVMTKELADKVKSAFPIPREQTVFWADAEFDLRPSGVAATDTGVYLKTNVDAVTLPGSEQQQSRLHYFKWNLFEPESFAEPEDGNLVLSVDRNCQERFVRICRGLATFVRAQEPSVGVHDVSVDLDRSGLNAEAAVVAAAEAINASDQVFVEQRAHVNERAGHGEMAEEANGILDRLQGHKAQILGRDNKKNGPDRCVDGVLVQTKYYKTARGSLEACFDPTTRQYRYMTRDGNPMQLEVPKDQYECVLRGFERKIRDGKVPGVSDPAEAKNIVRKGRLTYEQAVNLTKPGTIESLAYDAATGVVTCSCAFGISFLATSFMSYRETGDYCKAVQSGIAAGIQVFGLSFAQHMVISQLSRTGLSNVLMAPSQAVVGKLGFKASATIVNGLRALAGKSAISGAAASKQLAKMMRSNAVTAAATMVIFSVPETYKLMQGKASSAQYAQNIASLAASVAGGIAGTAAAGVAAAKVGAAAGTAVAPGVGTAVGLAGGLVGGAVGQIAAGALGGIFFEGDSASFGRYFNALVSCMAIEYLLDGREMDKLVKLLDAVPSDEFKSLLEETLSAEKQEEKVRGFLAPKFDQIVSERERFALPTDSQIEDALIALEDDDRDVPEGMKRLDVLDFGGLCVPDTFQLLNRAPGDPENLVTLGYADEESQVLIRVSPVDVEQAMPFGNTYPVIKGIHRDMDVDQGLICVECAKTAAGADVIYSIVKTVSQQEGAQYCLTMHVRDGSGIAGVQGFFCEAGATGLRDTKILLIMRDKGQIGADMSGWMADPYDPEYVRGVRMNLSEREEYDGMFPAHPLTLCRAFVRDVLTAN